MAVLLFVEEANMAMRQMWQHGQKVYEVPEDDCTDTPDETYVAVEVTGNHPKLLALLKKDGLVEMRYADGTRKNMEMSPPLSNAKSILLQEVRPEHYEQTN